MDENTKDNQADKSTAESVSTGVTTIDVDQIWIALGRYGKYQLMHTFVILCSFWSIAFHLLSVVFIGYRPSFECSHVPINVSDTTPAYSEFKVEYSKCSIRTTSNISGELTTDTSDCKYGWNYTYPNNEHFPTERSFVSEWNLVCSKDELTEISQTLLMVGQAFGAFIFTSLSDKKGRKPTYVACHMSLFLINMVTAFLPNYSSFAVMRFLTGAVLSGTALIGTILNLEMYPTEIRSNVEVAGLLVWTTGVAIMTPLAYLFRNVSWRYLQICFSCYPALSILQWWLTDESLRWLIANGKYDKAKAIIRKVCKVNKKNYGDVMEASGFQQFEMNALKLNTKERNSREAESEHLVNGNDTDKADVNRQPETKKSTKHYTVIDLIKSKRLFATSLIMWFAWTTNSATYYGIYLLSSSLSGNRFLNFFLSSAVEYPAALAEYIMFNRFGRKKASITFHLICCISLFTATILTTTANGSEAMLLASTVFTLIGKFAITGSFSTLFLYTPELYPTNMRNLGIGLSSAAARVGGMLAPFSRNLAEDAVWAPGLIFGIMSAIVAISMFWVPETNQRELPQTLEETEVWYKDNRFRLPGKKNRASKETTINKQ